MPGLYDMVRRVEELGGEIKQADGVVAEATVIRDRAKRAFEVAEANLTKNIAITVAKRSERDGLATKLQTEALKTGEPLDPADHTPIIIEEDDERTTSEGS